MAKEENELEQRLLNHASLDELIKLKMEEELKAELKKANTIQKKELITDIAKVPSDLIFSKKAVYKLFNRISKNETCINGMQAEGMLGLQTAIRAKFLKGQMDAFSTDTAYVKFEYIEC